MTLPLIVNFYEKLPQPSNTDDQDLWRAGVQEAMREFRQSVRNNYTEGTLQRLLQHPEPLARQAAVLALGIIGTMVSNAAVAASLKDEDMLVRRFANDALWEIWCRGGDPNHCWQLQQALQHTDPFQVLEQLSILIDEASEFAEAYNQRAIILFKRGEYIRCLEDCRIALKLNPYHFGAAAGMGQCYLKLKKPRAALRAFKQALEVNPGLTDLNEAVRSLLEALGE